MEIAFDGKNAFASDPATVGVLSRGFFGKMRRGKLVLSPEEALYLMDVRGAACSGSRGKPLSFNALAANLMKGKKLLARYLAFKEWRERGLILADAKGLLGDYGQATAVEYDGSAPVSGLPAPEALFFPESLMSTIDDAKAGKQLYEKGWFGQFGEYKAAHKGSISKLDAYETIYLSGKGNLKLLNSARKKVLSEASARIKYFPEIYAVYEDWRENGFVVKTGFKFGTHFRIYFPGAAPSGKGGWVHSKHVLHVFPRRSKLLTSEWARAIRVAHSVRKTFILAIPGKKNRGTGKGVCDFALYHRRGGEALNPKNSDPGYLMLALSEDEYLGGVELSAALEECAARGLNLVLAIADRETSVTYYLIKRIKLPHSRFDYFEISWLNP